MKALLTSIVTGRIHRTRQAIAAASLLGLGSVHAATFAVTSLTDDNPGSLREAITLANASTGVPDTIVFNTNGTIRLASRLPDITDDLTIDGSDAAVTLSGNRTVQLLFVGPGKRLEIKRLTLVDGYCASPCSGGAILNVGKLKVTQSTFSGNSESFPTRYEPGAGLVIPTRNEPGGGLGAALWRLRGSLPARRVDHRADGDRHERSAGAHLGAATPGAGGDAVAGVPAR